MSGVITKIHLSPTAAGKLFQKACALEKEIERLQSRVSENCDAPTGWIAPDKYKAACESKMEFFKKIKELREHNEKLQARVAELYDLIKYAQVESGVCMCGDDIKDHNQASGHSPVDVWDHAVEQVDKGGISEAFILRKQAEAVEYEIISLCGDLRKSKYRGISVKELLHESVSRSSKIRNKAKKFDD